MSNALSWYDLMVNDATIQQLGPEQLEKAHRMADGKTATLALGISGLGNLMACAANNKDSGLSEDAVESVGWMLDSLGRLLATMNDTQGLIQHRLDALSQSAKPKPPRA